LPRRTSRSPSSVSEKSGSILQFKVWLLGLSPMVWRRVHVPAAFTLRQLHGVIQVATGFRGRECSKGHDRDERRPACLPCGSVEQRYASKQTGEKERVGHVRSGDLEC